MDTRRMWLFVAEQVFLLMREYGQCILQTHNTQWGREVVPSKSREECLFCLAISCE